jgi:hypothetical protein
MASQIRKEPTAFSTAPRRSKSPRVTDEAHLRWIRTLPCLITGTVPVEAAHIRYADLRFGKRETGKSEKPSDKFTVPLAPELHREQHAQYERAFWAYYHIDPVQVAAALYGVSGNDEAAEIIIQEARNSRAGGQHG